MSDIRNIEMARIEAAKVSLGTSGDPIYQMILKQFALAEAGGKVLDFGAGTGSLARLLCTQEKVKTVTAADIYDFSSGETHAKLKWVFGDLNNPLPVADAMFDTIVAAEVIEHLENPRFVVREWFRLLKPGGLLLFSTPNNESWRAIISLVMKKHFVAFTGSNYPAHITALLQADMQRILQEAGFESPRFTYTDHGDLPKLTKITWQAVSFGLLKGARFSDNLLCIAKKPKIKKIVTTTYPLAPPCCMRLVVPP